MSLTGKKIGNYLDRIRKIKGLSTPYISNKTNISAQGISDILNGKVPHPSIIRINDICRVLDIDITNLIIELRDQDYSNNSDLYFINEAYSYSLLKYSKFINSGTLVKKESINSIECLCEGFFILIDENIYIITKIENEYIYIENIKTNEKSNLNKEDNIIKLDIF